MAFKTTVTGPIDTKYAGDSYPTGYANKQLGGCHNVGSATERDAIPTVRRLPYMLVSVANYGGNPAIFWLKTSGDLSDNTKWELLPLGATFTGGIVYKGSFNGITGQTTTGDDILDLGPSPIGTTNGHFYICTTAGTFDPGGGFETYNLNDWIIYEGTSWRKVEQAGAHQWATITNKPAIIQNIGDGTFIPVEESSYLTLVNRVTVLETNQLTSTNTIVSPSPLVTTEQAVLDYTYDKATIDAKILSESGGQVAAKKYSWTWSEGVVVGSDLDFIIPTAVGDNEIGGADACILFVDGSLQYTFTVESTTYLQDTIRLTGATPGGELGTAKVTLFYNRSGLGLDIPVDANLVVFTPTGTDLIATTVQTAIEEIDQKVFYGFAVDGFAFAPENIAVVDGANGNDGTASVGGSSYLTFEAAATAIKSAYDSNPDKLFLVYVKAFDGFYAPVITSNGQHTYPEIHYYFEPKAILRSSGSGFNKPFGDLTNGAGNYWIHGKGEFYADPAMAFSVTWGFGADGSKVFLSAAVIQNLGIVNDLGGGLVHIDAHIDQLLTSGNFQGKSMRGGSVEFYDTTFVGGMWWGHAFQNRTSMRFNHCTFGLNPGIFNPSTGSYTVKDRAGSTLFVIDMTDTDMSRQSRLADFSLFTTIQDTVDYAVTADNRVAAFEVALSANSYGHYFEFRDCDFIIDQDKAIGFKIVKSTDTDASDPSTFKFIRPRFLDYSAGTTTAIVAYKTSTAYSDPVIIIEDELSNADTYRTSHTTPASNPDIQLNVDKATELGKWYVNPSYGGGVSTGSPQQPFTTIAAAVAVASSGDEIYLSAGTHAGGFTTTKNLSIFGIGGTKAGFYSNRTLITGNIVIDVTAADVFITLHNLQHQSGTFDKTGTNKSNVEMVDCRMDSVYVRGTRLHAANTTFATAGGVCTWDEVVDLTDCNINSDGYGWNGISSYFHAYNLYMQDSITATGAVRLYNSHVQGGVTASTLTQDNSTIVGSASVSSASVANQSRDHNIWYVKGDASFNGNGSRKYPFTLLQSAINAASDDDIIRIIDTDTGDSSTITCGKVLTIEMNQDYNNYGGTQPGLGNALTLQSGATGTILKNLLSFYGLTLECVYSRIENCIFDPITITNGANHDIIDGSGDIVFSGATANLGCTVLDRSSNTSISSNGTGVNTQVRAINCTALSVSTGASSTTIFNIYSSRITAATVNVSTTAVTFTLHSGTTLDANLNGQSLAIVNWKGAFKSNTSSITNTTENILQKVYTDALSVSYDNSGSSLSATDVDTAIDELDTEKLSKVNYGALSIKTLDASGIAAAGADRFLAIAANSGTADDMIELTGLSVGDKVLLVADAGDTITVKHNDVGATIKIITLNGSDFVLDTDHPTEFFLSTSTTLVEIKSPAQKDGGYYFSTPASTTLGVATPAKAAGTTTAITEKGLTHSTNRLTVASGEPADDYIVTATISVTKATGGATLGSFYIAKGGTVIAASKINRSLANTTDEGAIALQTITSLAGGDYIEVWVETSNGDDLTVESGNVIVRSL